MGIALMVAAAGIKHYIQPQSLVEINSFLQEVELQKWQRLQK